LTFGVPKYSSAVSTVELEIVPSGDGCAVTLTNLGVPVEWAEQTRVGWVGILAKAEMVVG